MRFAPFLLLAACGPHQHGGASDGDVGNAGSGEILVVTDATYVACPEGVEERQRPLPMPQDIATRRMGDGSDTTVLAFAKQMLPGVSIDSWMYCDGAGSGTSVDRAVAYNSDPRYLRMTIARGFTQEPPQVHYLTTKILCTAKLGGVVSPYPLSVTYMDNI